MKLQQCIAGTVLCLWPAVAAAQSPAAPAPRRRPLTPELERTAFADSAARVILHRARVARLTQDSALRGYDAKTFLRFSVGMGVRLAPDKLLIRTEQAAHVRWTRIPASGSNQPAGAPACRWALAIWI